MNKHELVRTLSQRARLLKLMRGLRRLRLLMQFAVCVLQAHVAQAAARVVGAETAGPEVVVHRELPRSASEPATGAEDTQRADRVLQELRDLSLVFLLQSLHERSRRTGSVLLRAWNVQVVAKKLDFRVGKLACIVETCFVDKTFTG